MATLRKRRAARKVTNTDYEYEIGTLSEQEINVSSQNTIVSEQNDSDFGYHEETPAPQTQTPAPEPANEGEEGDSNQHEVVVVQEGEQSCSEENEPDQSPRAKWLRKWKRSDPGLCCVCIDEDATKENVLVYCDGKECDVVVHQDPWYCDRCIAMPSEAVHCVLCPNDNGAFRKVRASCDPNDPLVWIHILCAFWMPGMHIGSALDLRDIQVVNVDPKNWGKKCNVCNSDEGASIHCDAGQCKNWIHATCAVSFGLTEYLEEQDISDPYFIYCRLHGSGDQPRKSKVERWIRKRDMFLEDESSRRWKERSSQFQDGEPGGNIREIFEDTYAEYTSQREKRITDIRRRFVRLSSKYSALLETKEKTINNAIDFRVKIPIAKAEQNALKNYFDKASKAVISLVPQMRNINVETSDEAMKIENLMETMTSIAKIRWTTEARTTAKTIKVSQLNTHEVRSLNIKSVVKALAKAAKEEKERARQKGRRGGFKGRGRPKAPIKVKERAVGQKETPEGDEGGEQRSPKRTTRSRVASVKRKSKQIEDESGNQKDTESAEKTNAPKKLSKARLKFIRRDDKLAAGIAKRGPKRKREEVGTFEDTTQNPTNINPEDHTELSKKKRVQENLSTNSQSTDMVEVQASQVNTETSTVSSKRNTRQGKRKRTSDVPFENTVEGDEQIQSNNSDQVKADEVTEPIPAKRQYKRSRKPANKEKSEKTSKSTYNDQEVSSPAQDEQTSETVQDSPSTTSNETMSTCKPNEPVLVTRVEPKMVFKRRRRRKVAPASPKPKPKLRPIAPKDGFPVVLNIGKHKNPESEDIEYTTNDVIESTPTSCESFSISTITPEFITQHDSINIINEDISFNKRSGGLLGISNLLNPVDDSPSSTSTIFDTYAHTYFYEATKNYNDSNDCLYQKSIPSNNVVSAQSIGYGSTTDTSADTPPLQQRYFMADLSPNQMTFGVPSTTHASISESRSNTFTNSYVDQGELNTPFSNPFIVRTTNYTPFVPTNQTDTSTFTNSYVPTNQNDSIPTFTSSYEGTSTFNNVTSNVQTPAGNTSNINGLDALVTAAEFVERIPGSSELTPFQIDDDDDEIQDEATEETLQDQSQIHDAHDDLFYNESCTIDNETFGSSEETSEDNDAQNVETVVVQPQDEDSKEGSVTSTQETQDMANTPDTADTAETAISEEQLTPGQYTGTKLRRKRGPVTGTRKKAGRKPKVKAVEEEIIQPRTPIPQPNCTVCQLVIPPANDQPSATYITPNRARESMLHKGRDKVNRMVRCGYCSNWYHLACMVPPRRTMPTGGYIWRCADCDHPSGANSTGDEPSGHSTPASSTKKWNLRSATK
ncbi:9028_t:CDS:2 [Funneliformis mosseae]|uniref:9028_t:CDS:1 n=1 Tax=Funneliformis mosseae TaxID=27381 RepID=A0A9N8WM13_FUNMO|nr:9028_t:CDS:2 [Funneliformis mosseae]